MRRRSIAQLLTLIPLVVLMLEASAGHAAKQTEPSLITVDGAKLGDDDKSELVEVLRLQTELGDQVWPGFGRARVPIILFNDSFEFLVGEPSPPSPWVMLKGDSFNGKPYHRRVASNPQGFAVAVGDGWAGSLSTLDWGNRRNPLQITRELHVMMVLHEMFHAYQAIRSPERFKQAIKVYAAEARYPFKEPEFAAAWNKEGSLLAAALKAKKAKDLSATRLAIREFLQVRDVRRASAALSPEFLSFERELEWLEGLAKYVEIGFYQLAATRDGDPAYSRYRPGLLSFHFDFARLENQLGRQDGDLRFYLSGMAQARLLDTVSPGWKEKMMMVGSYSEELLRIAARLNAKNEDNMRRK